MLTHTFTFTWSNGGPGLSKNVVLNAGQEINTSESIPANAGASSNAQRVEIEAKAAKIIGLYITGDRNMIVKTNSQSSPANTFKIPAEGVFAWTDAEASGAPSGWGAALRDTEGDLVTTDIEDLYVCNLDADNGGDTDSAPGTIEVRVILDPTA